MTNRGRPEDEWELSKENVQPLRQGRKFSSLNAGLQPLAGDQMSRIKEEKQMFETELRMYSGGDPLEIWHRYILWTEQTYPKGGRDGNLIHLLERCLAQFREQERYKNDERYVQAWIKLADACDQPQDLFSYMYDQKIGLELSCFYDAWATVLEKLGNLKKADAIYLEGLKQNARPYDVLKRRHEEFQKRVARGCCSSEQEEVDVAMEDQRTVLSQLKSVGKKHQAPVNRVGPAKQSVQGGRLLQSNMPNPPQVAQNFQILCDNETVDTSSLPPQTGEWTHFPHRSQTNKENEMKPGVWSKAKVPVKKGAMPSHTVSAGQPAFKVHIEEDQNQPMTTPRKLPEMGYQVLSSRKPEKPTNPIEHIKETDAVEAPNQRSMYCKDKIYGGNDEFSFEEIRAAVWKKKEKQKQLEKEEKELEERHQDLLRQRRQFLEQEQEFKRQQLVIQQEQQAFLEECKRQMQLQRQHFEKERVPNNSSRQLIFEEKTSKSNVEYYEHGNTENIPPQYLSQLRAPQQSQQTAGLQLQYEHQDDLTENNQSLNISNRTPSGVIGVLSSGGPTPESLYKTMTAPSPTVNTREAIQLVMGMFNTSLELEKQMGWEENREDKNITGVSGSNTGNKGFIPASSSAPFVVFDETLDKQKQPSAATGHIEMDQDKENNLVDNVSIRRSRSRLEHVKKSSISTEGSQTDMDTDFYMITDSSVRQARDVFEDENLEGIESHQRDDITLAPLGSHLSFAQAAKFASTPFNPNNSALKNSLNYVSSLNESESKVDPKWTAGSQIDTVSKVETTAKELSKELTISKADLSPIMEGSAEDQDSLGSITGGSHLDGAISVLKQQPVRSKLKPVTKETENLQGSLVENLGAHVIDTTSYIPPDLDERTENLLSMSICINPRDPFDSETIEGFLKQLPEPLSSFSNFVEEDKMMPDIRVGSIFIIDGELYDVMKLLGEGGFAKVYKVSQHADDNLDMSEDFACKVQCQPAKWEFYICSEIQKRLSRLNEKVDLRDAMMKIKKGCFFINGSFLISDFHSEGTLLDFANNCRQVTKGNMLDYEVIIMYLTIELLHIVEKLHKCKIIHGDVKPDNVLMKDLPSSLPTVKNAEELFAGQKRCMVLIDFGQSIDMTKYPPDTAFMAKVKTGDFQCIEMKTDRPWTYQTDLFGLAGSIHVLIFGQYMSVYQSQGTWLMTHSLPRSWNRPLWQKLFHTLLNIPSCDEIPDLAVLRREFEEYFIANLLHKYNSQCRKFMLAMNDIRNCK
ncbi:hypothetical protein CHS0354_028109 [Potamilus streckersoni]|uniref:Mitotic checkpoint serine/threonine-protein kinase BUB1 n=1 Tax=Potamilus streckersoni TaxID=2493646 RepID=A0AAE0THY3_9BIVA|nr:hypothetical protein CHS0354_028109 [Potamilus streckersoni]